MSVPQASRRQLLPNAALILHTDLRVDRGRPAAATSSPFTLTAQRGGGGQISNVPGPDNGSSNMSRMSLMEMANIQGLKKV